MKGATESTMNIWTKIVCYGNAQHIEKNIFGSWTAVWYYVYEFYALICSSSAEKIAIFNKYLLGNIIIFIGQKSTEIY